MPRKPLTPEQKQDLVERLAKARTAKAVPTKKTVLLETPAQETEITVEVLAPEVPDSFTPWTVDFRDNLPEDLTQKDVDKVIADLASEQKKLQGVYVTDDQAEALKKVTLPKGVVINVGR